MKRYGEHVYELNTRDYIYMHGYMYGNPTSKLMKRHFCSRWGKTAPGTYLHGNVRKWDKFNIYVLF